MADKRKQILDKVLLKGAAPSLSPVVIKLVEMASDDEASAKDLAGVIEKSPGLTARLLRLVNSPAQRISEDEVTSVQRAVVLLGLREVRIMALSISLRDTLPVKKGDHNYHDFWRASLHRAALARQAALELATGQAEEAFVAGLLLELGLPLLLSVLDPDETDGFPGAAAPLEGQLAWERENLGLDHRELGALVMEQWGLPRSLRDCLDPDEQATPGPEGPGLARLSAFAQKVSEAFFLPEKSLLDVPGLAKESLGLSQEKTSAVLASAIEYVGQAAEVLEIELDHGADLLEVMEKANAALGRLSRQMAPAITQVARAGLDDSARMKEQVMVNALEAVAHEIRNPLMSVGGFARRLAGQASGEGRVKRYAEVIVSEAARLDHALGEMLSLVTPFEPKPQEMDLARLIGEVAQKVPLAASVDPGPAASSGLKLHLPQGPVNLRADPKGMSDAVLRMVEYGTHLLTKGREGLLHLHLKAEGNAAVLTLFGEGEPTLVESGILAGKSFGPELALAQARRIVEAHKGYLALGSSPHGKGFVITATVHGLDKPDGAA